MKRLLWITFLIVLILTGCAAQQSKSEENAYVQISQAEAMEVMAVEKNYILLDVRTAEEYREAHIPGAICIPNETIGDTAPMELPEKDQLILVYCRSGRRSKLAAQKLADLGYTNVMEFGGILTWTGETVSD